MYFCYENYAKGRYEYPDKYNAIAFHNTGGIRGLRQTVKTQFNCIHEALALVAERTTKDYHVKMYGAQKNAHTYSTKVFPAYEFLLPETIADDWNSAVDWHKEWPTRDHSLHQPLTAYIVQTLLGFGDPQKSLITPRGPLLDICVDLFLESQKTKYLRSAFISMFPDFENWDVPRKREWAMSFFYETAVFAALFHDIGYPWQYITGLKKVVKFADYLQEDISNLGSGTTIMEFIQQRIIVYPFYGYETSDVGKDVNSQEVEVKKFMERVYKDTHGFPGALALLYLSDKSFKYHDSLDEEAASNKLKIEWAAVAIMMHDMEKFHTAGNDFLKLRFDVDPLSCIIAMADVLEEFERPKAKFENDENDHEGYVKLTYDSPCVGTDLIINGAEMTVDYVYKDQLSKDQSKEFRCKEIVNYFDPMRGFIDLSALGIDRVKCDTRIPQEKK